MKIIVFHGGLGNQLFEYEYYAYLHKMFPKECFYSYFPKRGLSLHNGLEIMKWFDVTLPKNSFLTDMLCFVLYNIHRLCRKMRYHIPLISDDRNIKYSALFHQGWFQSTRYIKEMGLPKLRKDLIIDSRNQEIIDMMSSCNSVSIHIRRGDFLLKKNIEIIGGICTPTYYERAIQYIEKEVDNPVFFFFSDDTDYIRNAYKMKNKVVVDFNYGEKSFYDMLLMSHAKYMILSNSTFSCWAAYLNKNAQKVLCPTVWNTTENPQLADEKWIKIKS